MWYNFHYNTGGAITNIIRVFGSYVVKYIKAPKNAIKYIQSKRFVLSYMAANKYSLVYLGTTKLNGIKYVEPPIIKITYQWKQ